MQGKFKKPFFVQEGFRPDSEEVIEFDSVSVSEGIDVSSGLDCKVGEFQGGAISDEEDEFRDFYELFESFPELQENIDRDEDNLNKDILHPVCNIL